MKSPTQVAHEMAELRRRISLRYGRFVDEDLVPTMVSSLINSKAMEEVDSIIGTYKPEELVIAAAELAQQSVDGARASLIQERQ